VKAPALAVLLVFLAIWPVFSQSSLMEAVFLPPRFFVGDRVELRLTYDLSAAEAVEPPVQWPVHAWIEFHDIEVQDRRAPGESGEVLVRIFFTPFYSGETVLPPLRLGDLNTGELLVKTRSALQLEQADALRGPRRQLNLPLTWLRLLTFLAVGVGVPLLLYFLLFYGIRGFTRIREARIRRLPYLHARKSLNQLASGRTSMEGKTFFILLSLAIRRYLSERLSMPLMSATTGEIAGSLKAAGLEESVSQQIHEMLKAADLIKFSGKRANKREMERSLKTAGSIVEQVEERITHVEV
jgi:RNA-binding protein YhbY